MNKQNIARTIWASTFLVYLLPMLKWGSGLGWNINKVNLLSLFPLLGLWAFAQMWQHYAVGIIKRRHPADFDFKGWYKATSQVVLALILLHPAILVIKSQLAGLTPFDVVGAENVKYLYFAYFGLASFLLYEVAGRMQKSAFWKKHFATIRTLNVLAMLAIFVHSLNLGRDLQAGWLQVVWYIMLVAFIGFIIDSYTFKPKSN